MTSNSVTARRPLSGTLLWLVLLLNALLLCSSAGAQLLEMTDLMAHPQHYDRKEVIVLGQVINVQPATDRQGQPAFQFLLKDGVGILKVLSRMEVQDGDQIIVEGTFTRRRQSGRLPVYNEVTATSVRALNQFNPDLVA